MAKQEYDEGFHRVRGVATVLALQTALLPQVKQYKEAVEIYRNWEKNIAQRAESTEEALAIKCLGGEAALEYARSVKVDSLAGDQTAQRSAATGQGSVDLHHPLPRRVSAAGAGEAGRSPAGRKPRENGGGQELRRGPRPRQDRLGATAPARLETGGGSALAGRGPAELPLRLDARAVGHGGRGAERHPLLLGLSVLGRGRLLRCGGDRRVPRPALSQPSRGAAGGQAHPGRVRQAAGRRAVGRRSEAGEGADDGHRPVHHRSLAQ